MAEEKREVASTGSKINFKELQEELHKAIESDKRYWLENDAKFRAVNQRVATYDEFRDIVRAAHLRPLENKQSMSAQQPQRKGCIWNTVSPTQKADPAFGREKQMEQAYNVLNDLNVEANSLTTDKFVRRFRARPTPEERLQMLEDISSTELQTIFKTEIPMGLLGELLEALLVFPTSTQSIVIVFTFLEQLAETQRFNLSLEFLSSVEKTVCRQLMEKLFTSLRGRQQDLAELGITEWSLITLRNKYKV